MKLSEKYCGLVVVIMLAGFRLWYSSRLQAS